MNYVRTYLTPISLYVYVRIGDSPVMLSGLIQGHHKLETTPLGCGGGSKTLSVRFSS